MTQKNISINGRQVPVVVDFQTLLNFEKIADKSFFDTYFKKLADRIAIIAAAAISANEKTSLTVDDIMGQKDLQAIHDITANFNVVMELVGEFFQLPKVVKDAEEREAGDSQDDDTEQPKN
jgi:hypothetical protein